MGSFHVDDWPRGLHVTFSAPGGTLAGMVVGVLPRLELFDRLVRAATGSWADRARMIGPRWASKARIVVEVAQTGRMKPRYWALFPEDVKP
jgi:anti-sigma factor RsiW